MTISEKVLCAIIFSAVLQAPAYADLANTSTSSELDSKQILLADDYDPHKSIFDTYASKAKSAASFSPSNSTQPILSPSPPQISSPLTTSPQASSPASFHQAPATKAGSAFHSTPLPTQPPVRTGGYNPAENVIVMPAKPKSQVISENPEGSLNFSAPPHAHGPFNDVTAISMNRQNNFEGLLDYARAWTAEQPKNGFAWFCLGQGAIKLGNFDAAVEGFRRAALYTPQEPKIWNNLSAAYCKRQQWALAIKAIYDGESASGAHCGAKEWYVFANALKDLKEYENAIKAYDKALRLNPNFPEANNNRGICYEMLGNNAAASQSYNTAASQGNSYGGNNQANLEASQRAQAQQQYNAQLQSFNFKSYNDARRNGSLRNN
jgi:Tfp pilus assembly protein PilF